MSPSVGKRSRRERQKQIVISPSLLFHEAKLFLLIYLFFSQDTPLLLSALNGHAEIYRLLLENAADENVKSCK